MRLLSTPIKILKLGIEEKKSNNNIKSTIQLPKEQKQIREKLISDQKFNNVIDESLDILESSSSIDSAKLIRVKENINKKYNFFKKIGKEGNNLILHQPKICNTSKNLNSLPKIQFDSFKKLKQDPYIPYYSQKNLINKFKDSNKAFFLENCQNEALDDDDKCFPEVLKGKSNKFNYYLKV